MALAAVRIGLTPFVALGVWGCSLPDVPGSGRMPVLPKVESIQLDLSFFQTHTPDGSAPSTNWAAARARVAFVDSAVTPLFTVPGATLRAAVIATPTHDGGKWKWTYGTSLDGQAYTGYLQGFANGNVDSWSLVVNAPGMTPTIANYLWVEGISGYEGTVGTWVIYHPPIAGVQETMVLEWGVQTTQTTFQLRRVGSTMTYVSAGQNRSIDYLSGTPGQTFALTWNPVTGAGRVTTDNPNFLCWDAQQHDVACS